MKCFNCGFDTKTIYPKVDGQQFVQKMCLACGWKSFPTEVISKSALEAREKRYTANVEVLRNASKNLEVQAYTSRKVSEGEN